MLQVADSKQQEGQVEREEEGEEGHGRSQGADQEKEGKDEPAHQVQAEGVEEYGFAEADQIRLNRETARGQDYGEREPETAVG